VGGLRRGTSIAAHSASGCAHSVCALVLDVPKNAANIGSISLRTAVFEPLALAGLAWLFPGRVSTPDFLACAGRYLLALSLIVSISFNCLQQQGAAGVGLMFAIWVVTLHLPRVLGLYGIPGAPHDPDEWSRVYLSLSRYGEVCGR
jgi:hypothetical protein